MLEQKNYENKIIYGSGKAPSQELLVMNKNNDWVAEAIPSVRKGKRLMDTLLQDIPYVNLLYPGTYVSMYQRMRKGSASIHYGSLRFSEKGMLTKHNQPKLFRKILREPALLNDQGIQGIVKDMVANDVINGYKFEIRCSDKEGENTRIEMPKTKKSWFGMKQRRTLDVIRLCLNTNNPAEAKAALLLAHEVTKPHAMPPRGSVQSAPGTGPLEEVKETERLLQGDLRPHEVNLVDWVGESERSQDLKNALQGFQMKFNGVDRYSIVPRTQELERSGGRQPAMSSGQNGRFDRGAVSSTAKGAKTPDVSKPQVSKGRSR